MPRLLAQVAEQLTLDANVRVLLQRLSAPAVRCAKLEPSLLTSLQHPLWRPVDRIAALCESRGGTQAARLAAHLEPVLVKLEHSADATSAAYERALADVDALATGWADSQLADAGVSDVDVVAGVDGRRVREADPFLTYALGACLVRLRFGLALDRGLADGDRLALQLVQRLDQLEVFGRAELGQRLDLA